MIRPPELKKTFFSECHLANVFERLEQVPAFALLRCRELLRSDSRQEAISILCR